MGFAGAVWAEAVPAEKIRGRIAELVEEVLKAQQPNGGFKFVPMNWEEYPAGTTALAVLALQHARPHLTGELGVRVKEGIRKGLIHLAQAFPDPRTYSAALAISAMEKENPQFYAQPISLYATMLVRSQSAGAEASGMWSYGLAMPMGGGYRAPNTGDRSNTQMAILGLYDAARAGFPASEKTWLLTREHYVRTQSDDGGWGYMVEEGPGAKSTMNMTLGGTNSLFICTEMLTQSKHAPCAGPAKSEAIEKGLQWIAVNWEEAKIGRNPYGLHALERLGTLMGSGNIGGHDWYNEGAAHLTAGGNWRATTVDGGTDAACFVILFLSRGLEPILINKLERRGTDDWNNDPYDVKHLTEYINDHETEQKQWRIETLEAPLEVLVRTPILYISGHKKLDFNDAEKAKLKAYVAGGGTILGQACCSKKEFDESFRSVMKELFAGDFVKLAQGHALYKSMGAGAAKPEVDVLWFEGKEGRPAVIYLPTDQCCRWQTGGAAAKPNFAVGMGITLYVMDCKK